MAWVGILFLVAVSVYMLISPDRFGMRLGLTYFPMPYSPWAKILGWSGVATALVLAVILAR
jgi:hypothetical protein